MTLGKSSTVKGQFGKKSVLLYCQKGLYGSGKMVSQCNFCESPVIAGSRFYYEYRGTRDLFIQKIEKRSHFYVHLIFVRSHWIPDQNLNDSNESYLKIL